MDSRRVFYLNVNYFVEQCDVLQINRVINQAFTLYEAAEDWSKQPVLLFHHADVADTPD